MLVLPSAGEDDNRTPFSFSVFRKVWVANLTSNLGALTLVVGVSWLMASSGASAQMVALVQAASSLPIVLFSLLAGALADNVERRSVMIWAQSFRAGVSVALAVLTYCGVVTPWLLLAFTFLVGCGVAMNGPAWQASVGDMVSRRTVPDAVVVNAVGMNIARSAGPALGGVIVAIGGGAAAFLVNALSALPLIVVLARWRTIRTERLLPREHLWEAMAAGLQFSVMSPAVRTVLVRSIIFAIPASAIQALMPLVARDLLGGGPLVFGLLLASFGLGAVGGAFVMKPLRRALSPDERVRTATVLMSIGLAIAGISRELLVTLPVLTLAGIGWVLAFSTVNASVQLAAPRWVLARALSLYQTATFLGITAGSWAIGACANQVGTSSALLIAACVAMAGLAVSKYHPLAEMNRDDMDSLSVWSPPETAVPIDDDNGPVIIAIEHRIASNDISEFRLLMRDRRRIRIRDGARRWTLLRDVADAEVWIERYEVSTWVDYIRHVGRRMNADALNSDALRRLGISAGPTVVRRMIEVRDDMPRRRGDEAPAR